MEKLEKNITDIIETLGFIKDHMATKDEVMALSDRLHAVESKIEGVNRRLDGESMQRTELKLPERVRRLEERAGIASPQ